MLNYNFIILQLSSESLTVSFSSLLTVIRAVSSSMTITTKNDDVITVTPTPVSHRFRRLDNNRTKIVLIVAYMHTGSSYTGALIQQHPGTYYVYEPLRYLQKATLEKTPIKFIGENIRYSTCTGCPIILVSVTI